MAGTYLFVAVAAILVLAEAGSGQSQKASQKQAPSSAAVRPQAAGATVKGHVTDAKGRPAADAAVFLQHATEVPGTDGTPTQAVETRKVHTNGQGAYSIPSVSDGVYALHAERTQSERSAPVRVELGRNESKTIDLAFLAPNASESVSQSQPEAGSQATAKAPEFFDEPQFTVAGITQATNSGGHGSDTVLRASEELVKATSELGANSPENKALVAGSAAKDSVHKEMSPNESKLPAPADAEALARERATIRTHVLPDSAVESDSIREEQGELHHQLAQLDEKLGDPLEAVREYQRAAELVPSEAHLFDWASELLSHGALEPATEVLARGSKLYPQSMRMLSGLGVAWYARGSYERASQYLVQASDLAPTDPTPYLFMGQMQSAETVSSQACVDRLARFARLAPDNASANYYYAVALSKRARSGGAVDDATFKQIESLLQHALQLDPKLGAADLQLGILYSERGDWRRATIAYQQAIAASPDLAEAHYRLGLAYRRTGDEVNAQKELRLHDELVKKSKEESERRRQAVQQFVMEMGASR